MSILVPRTIYRESDKDPFSSIDNDFAAFGIIEFPSKSGKRLFLLVRTKDNKLKLPGGKKRGGELPYETLIREVKEEINLQLNEIFIKEKFVYLRSRSAHDFLVIAAVLSSAPKLSKGKTGEIPRPMSMENIKKKLSQVLPDHREALMKYLHTAYKR